MTSIFTQLKRWHNIDFSSQKCNVKVILMSCDILESNIRAPVLLNLLNELGKRHKMRGILFLFPNLFN